jgi:phosphate uptake regulator
MERKLIKQGGGGYTIYLPKQWVEKKKLKQGDTINVDESEHSLIIGSEVKERKEITLEMSDKNEKDIQNILTHLYRKGFNKIIVKTSKKDLIKEIKKITNKLLLGFEVTDIKENGCIIENISEPEGGKYEVILKKVFLIISETQTTATEDFSKGKFSNFNELEEMKNNCDKFILFCRRLLIKEKYQKSINFEWELLTFLMHIEHTYYYMYKYAFENKLKPEKEHILLKNLEDYFALMENAYYKKDIDSIHKINSLKNEFPFGKCLKQIETSKGKNAVVYSFIRELFRLIQTGTSPILGEIFENN